MAAKGVDQFVVIDEKRSGPYRLVYDEPVFSPDSKYCAWCVNDGKRDMVVVDGEAGKPYECIVNFEGGIRFTSNDSLMYMVREGDNIVIVEEKIS